MLKLDIIIPVYNEDENIVRLLQSLENEITCNFRVLICYDSETDTTLKYIKDNKIIKSEVLLIRNPRKGPNSAIIKGIDTSGAKIILVYMADDFENIKLINRMTNLIELGNDLVIPTRFMSGGNMIGAAKTKEFVTRIGSYLIYYLARIPFKDCTNAFKMFSASLKDKIKFDSTTGFTFALELVAKSYFLKLKIVEIPSIWIEAENRKSNFKMLKWIPYYIYWLLYSTVKNYTLKIRNFFK
jgi:glycosyltransferase involved in cell wall biosynthesis